MKEIAMNKVLVTPRSITTGGHYTLDKLTEAGYDVVFCTPGQKPDEEELIGLLPGCVGYLAGVETISKKVLESGRGLVAISRNGTGVSNIDLMAADELNIKVFRAEGANTRGVVELTLGLILAAIRSIPFSDQILKGAGWKRRKGIELQGKILGLIGCGQIGQQVATLALGLDLKVISYEPYNPVNFTSSNDFAYVSLDNLLEKSDIISLHCPPAEDGSILINEKALGQMKDGVYLINTARGELIDEESILSGLHRGKIAGYATDVFRKEPPGNQDWIANDKVIATPHIGGFTKESVDRAMEAAVDNLLSALHSD